MRLPNLSENTRSNKIGVAVFVLFVVSTFFASIFYLNQQSSPDASADTSATSVNITNAAPSASGTSIDSGAASVSLTENTTTAVSVGVTVTDNNGCTDIATVDAVFFRTNVGGGSGCTPDDNDCYAVACTLDGGSCTGGADLTGTYTCALTIQYFADPTDAGSTYAATDWTAEITPYDSSGAGSTDTDTIEMNTLTALDVTAAINYGTLALNSDTGGTNQTTVITNTGNEAIDSQVSGTSMGCTVGTIAVGNQKYATSDVTYASLTDTLSGTPTTYELVLPQRTAGVITDDVYWGLATPASGVSGSCTGTNTFTAVTD
ncbi:hypothetical protein KJ611_04315 [Patescibacteria group bacterium]|nr:hypothetical protein [Patescibacteria group bacterium]MBU1705550.1 hypothetical protein [Patescibacteria group bacterium]